MSYNELLESAKSGNRPDYDILCGSLADDIYRTAYLTLMNKPDAEAVVKKAFCDGYGSIGRINDLPHLKAWILRELTKNIVAKLKEYKASGIIPVHDGEIPSAVASLSDIDRLIYSIFSLALLVISLVLFIHGIKSFVLKSFNEINISEVFESTIVLTLALAIFDLVKAIFESEVLGRPNHHQNGGSRTMVRFIGSIIIALAIESLMLVFKFAITDPSQIVYAIYLIGGVGLLMVALSYYLFVLKRGSIDRDN